MVGGTGSRAVGAAREPSRACVDGRKAAALLPGEGGGPRHSRPGTEAPSAGNGGGVGRAALEACIGELGRVWITGRELFGSGSLVFFSVNGWCGLAGKKVF